MLQMSDLEYFVEMLVYLITSSLDIITVFIELRERNFCGADVEPAINFQDIVRLYFFSDHWDPPIHPHQYTHTLTHSPENLKYLYKHLN